MERYGLSLNAFLGAGGLSGIRVTSGGASPESKQRCLDQKDETLLVRSVTVFWKAPVKRP